MKEKIYYIVFFVVLFLSFNLNIKSLTYGGCEYSEIARLKSFVSNVNLSYEYYISNNKPYFNVTISNIVPGMYFVDSLTGNTYNYNNTTEGEIIIKGYTTNNGNYKFYSSLSKCYGVKLGSKYYSFPSYNYYYENDLCKENQNYSLCQKWVNITYSYDEFKEKIEEYQRNKNKIEEEVPTPIVYKKTILDFIISFYIKYYYIILIGIIVICVSIMYVDRRKNRFDI